MRLTLALPALRRAGRTAAAGALAGALALGAAGCENDINVTNPNQPTTETFWRTAADAQAGLTATYSALLRLGTFVRWQSFAFDGRADVGTSFTPWQELQNIHKFTQPNLNFDVSRDSWADNFLLVNRANQVITYVPDIAMADTAKARIVGEAKFLRGLSYFRLVALFGGAPPLITGVPSPTDRPASADSAALWAHIEQDFTEAAAALPRQTMAQTGGRATAAAAQGMLGKTLLQQRKWQQAAAALKPIVDGQLGSYELVPNYATLFRQEGNNSRESVFEVQMGTVTTATGQGVGGLNMAKMGGPCGPTFCDARPTRWFYQQFLVDSTVDGRVDPRLDVTFFRYRGDTTMVYTQSWQRRYGSDTATVYWRKYGQYYAGINDEQWDVPINYKVLRYADVLLMYAEALNEQGQPATAAPYVNQVRARVNLRPIPAGLSQADMREAILRERLLEFGFEQQRWLDLGRHNRFGDLATLRAHDNDFEFFEPGKSHLFPVPQVERDLNPNIKQNPGWN